MILVEKVSKVFSNGSGPTYALREVSLKVKADALRIEVHAANGAPSARIYEMRAYLE